MNNSWKIVSPTMAIKLKEYGYNKQCHTFFSKMPSWKVDDKYLKEIKYLYGDDIANEMINTKMVIFTSIESISNISLSKDSFCAPTIEAVHKWLREEKHIIITILPALEKENDTKFKYKFKINVDNVEYILSEDYEYIAFFDTYDEALYTSVKNAINLLLEKIC